MDAPPRRRRPRCLRCRNLRKKTTLAKTTQVAAFPVGGDVARLLARSAHCQISVVAASLALSCARGLSSSRNGASSADSRIAKFASRHGPGGGSGAGQRERGDGADGQGEGEGQAG